MKKVVMLAVLAVSCLFVRMALAADSPHVRAGSEKQAGRYLVLAGGCNDCHTPGWMQSGGHMPVSEWLIGNPVGFRGPWGTTFPLNLRLLVHHVSERTWVAMFKGKRPLARYPMLPPMPWLDYHHFSRRDLAAIYVFIRGLGPAGLPAPHFVPPGHATRHPYIVFVPQSPAKPPVS